MDTHREPLPEAIRRYTAYDSIDIYLNDLKEPLSDFLVSLREELKLLCNWIEELSSLQVRHRKISQLAEREIRKIILEISYEPRIDKEDV